MVVKPSFQPQKRAARNWGALSAAIGTMLMLLILAFSPQMKSHVIWLVMNLFMILLILISVLTGMVLVRSMLRFLIRRERS